MQFRIVSSAAAVFTAALLTFRCWISSASQRATSSRLSELENNITMNKLLVSPSPHLHTKASTKSLMRDVVIALLPAVVVSVLFYGWSELLVLGVSVASCVLLEFLITKFLLKTPCTVGDWSAVITGVLLALNLPATTP